MKTKAKQKEKNREGNEKELEKEIALSTEASHRSQELNIHLIMMMMRVTTILCSYPELKFYHLKKKYEIRIS